MYFDGEYRRTREQNFAGASKLSSGKDELILRAHQERIKRQAEKWKDFNAVRIQKTVRGYLCRQKFKKGISLEFINRLKECEEREILPADIQYIVLRLHFIPCNCLTRNQLETVIRKAVTISGVLLQLASQDISWVWRIKVLLNYALKIMELNAANTILDAAVIMMSNALYRFTDLKSSNVRTVKKILVYLLSNNYMMVMRDILLQLEFHRNFSGVAQEQAELDLEIQNAISMIITPITLLYNGDDPQYIDAVLHSLCNLITAESNLSKPIKKYVLPVIHCKPDFPLQRLIDLFLCYPRDKFLPSMLYFFLVIDKNQTGIPKQVQSIYFRLLALLSKNLIYLAPSFTSLQTESPNHLEKLKLAENNSVKKLLRQCLKLLNTHGRSQVWMDVLETALQTADFETIKYHSTCLVHIFLCDPISPYRFKLISDVILGGGLLPRMYWMALQCQSRYEITSSTSLLDLLKRRSIISAEEAAIILPMLTVFCIIVFNSVSFITDEDLLRPDLVNTNGVQAFNMTELTYIACSLKDIAVGLILLAYPNSHTFPEVAHYSAPTDDYIYNSVIWSQTLTECTKVIREIYYRNERSQIINPKEWHSFLIPIPESGIQYHASQLEESQPPFSTLSPNSENPKHKVGAWFYRASWLLTSLPFTVPFDQRYRMFCNVLNKQMNEFQNPNVHLLQNVHLTVYIRRNYLYEDSFDRLSEESAPEIRFAIRIHFRNSLNMNEAGIDGGGIFKEFMSELLRTAFDPIRGFFILTKDNKLYPNPSVSYIYSDFAKHYYFIGRMVGKAIFEGIAVDIPMADFFLAELVDSANLYPSLLYTLDKDIYKNICYLRTFSGDWSTLGIDFTTTHNNFGTKEILELKRSGKEILLNNENVFEYTNLMAKQKLHKDINKQSRAFAEGLAQVLPFHMIRMFTPNEIQLLISGNQSAVDINDLQNYVVYSGGYSETHDNIKLFWKVFEDFTNEERGQLLKFVTSCSRPPLRGFKELNPPFCLHLVEEMNNSLPTSSTCLNILKLPLYKDEYTMKEKILYAIQSAAGFELS